MHCIKGQAIQKAVSCGSTVTQSTYVVAGGQSVHFFHTGASQSLLFSRLIIWPFIKKQGTVLSCISISLVEIDFAWVSFTSGPYICWALCFLAKK